MADQAELIRQQMDETRTSMTEKIEALEKQVSESVKDTAETVAETVHAASDTIDKTVETVSETIESVTHAFNIPSHIANHPWAALGGSVMLGFLLGSLVPGGRRNQQAPTPGPTPAPTPAPRPQTARESAEDASESEQPKSTTLLDIFGSLRSLAIGTAVGVVGKGLLNSFPQDLRSGLSNIIQDVTERLGGSKPVK